MTNREPVNDSTTFDDWSAAHRQIFEAHSAARSRRDRLERDLAQRVAERDRLVTRSDLDGLRQADQYVDTIVRPALDAARREFDLLDAQLTDLQAGNEQGDAVAAQLAALTPQQTALLAEAASLFGVNTDPNTRPLQLAAVKGYGNPAKFIPWSVVLITCGGMKLRFPMDDDTIGRLKRLFHCFKVEKIGHSERVIELPLPADLTLPETARTGIVRPPAQGRLPASMHGA